MWMAVNVPYNYRSAVVIMMTHHYRSANRTTVIMAMNRRANPGFYYYLRFGPFKGEQSNNGDH
jgi:hypothetical protein